MQSNATCLDGVLPDQSSDQNISLDEDSLRLFGFMCDGLWHAHECVK